MIVEVIKSNKRPDMNSKSALCKCDYCGGEFKRRFSYVSRSKNQFCGNKCKSLWQTENNKGKDNPLYTRIEVKCSNCGRSVIRKRCHFKRHENFFCSNKCKGEWKKKNLISSNKIWWRGGLRENNGYVQVLSKKHPYRNKANYVMEHRLVMEKHLGRYLEPGEVVHHKNGNKKDNKIENLMLFANSAEHLRFHALQNI